jgi:Zn-dependent protease with chaperone function
MLELVQSAVRATMDNLPDELAAYVEQRIRWELRPVPNGDDLELGAHLTDRGLFVGTPVRSAEDDEGGELYAAEGDDIAESQGAPEYFAAEGDDIAEVSSDEPGGVIVLFTSNIKPLDAEHVEAVILHELAHFLGETEEGVAEMGLG